MVRNIVRQNSYYDSATLMLLSNRLAQEMGASNVAVMMGTDSNKAIMRASDLLAAEGDQAGPSDLIMAVRAESEEIADAALVQAEEALQNRQSRLNSEANQVVRSLDTALRTDPDINLVVISVPGEHAKAEVTKALDAGKHVMLFSDNVTLEDEVALKRDAVSKGLLMMGPDCGTAIIGGAALCFANVVPGGHCGIVAAAGTGLQEVASIVGRLGGGISQAIGTGGRDVKDAVGGLMMLSGIDALDSDDATSVIVVVSKPPASAIEEKILSRLEVATKPVVVCFLGSQTSTGTRGPMTFTATLAEAAQKALELTAVTTPPLESLIGIDRSLAEKLDQERSRFASQQRYVRALYTGGTLCYEALVLAEGRLEDAHSNVHFGSATNLADSGQSSGHTFLDLGDDEFTQGRPHPMIDPTPRNARLIAEASDPETAVVLLDVVIGYGSHEDPAGEVAVAIEEARAIAANDGRYLAVVASVCGTDGDPQGYQQQRDRLSAAGALVVNTNAQATMAALALVTGQ